MIKTKVNAGALQMTLFIVVVIALLLASFLIFVHAYRQFKVQSNLVIETTQNVNKGFEFGLHNAFPLNDTTYIDLKGENYKSLKVIRNYWGIFEKITSKAKIKNYELEKVALIGAAQPKLNRTALFLEENNKPLILVGDTKIQGVVYLPESGVKTGYISGHSYYGDQLIYGSTRKSGQMPKVQSELKEHLRQIVNGNETNFIDIFQTSKLENSFSEPVQFYFSPNAIHLGTISLVGHIMVQSKTKIVVDASANLRDVILIAPEVIIKDNVIGIFQVIATKSINVGNNCKLNFPSALVVNHKESVSQSDQDKTGSINNLITINSGSTVDGVVFWDGISSLNDYRPQILIRDNVLIRGEVFCTKNLELRGTVHGTIYTSNFVAQQLGAIYQNHIYNGHININELPEEYVGLQLESTKKGILKWLY